MSPMLTVDLPFVAEQIVYSGNLPTSAEKKNPSEV